jgi:3-oxoadipate enol-lactonase
MSVPAEVQFADSTDGTHIAWRSFGARDAPAVVMMHSLGSSASMWTPQIDALSQRFRVVAIDTRGHGRSDAPAGPYTVDQLGRDVVAVADHAALDTFHAIGLSLGGQMAMWLAVHVPGRVRSIVLANTAAKLGNHDTWQTRIHAATTDGMPSIRDAVLDRWFAPGFAQRHPDWFAQAQATFDTTDPVGYAGCCAALRDSDLSDVVSSIEVPTLVIGGDVDLATPPAQAMWLHEHIDGSELTIFDDAGHLSNLDRAAEFSDRLAQFLAT